jgi:hypothetical protein
MARERRVLCCDSPRASLMRMLVCLILLSLLSFHTQTRQADAEWPPFRDGAHRVSFAYPPDLRPVNVPVENLHIGGLVKKVSVVSNNPRSVGSLPMLTVQVFTCDDPLVNPRVPCRDESSYRKWCNRFETFPVGDSVAIQCVTYGRAACHWSAIVLRDKGSVEISAPAAEYAVNVSTTDQTVCTTRVVTMRMKPPVKEILASFRLHRPE